MSRSSNSKRTVVGLDIEPGAINAAVVSTENGLTATQVATTTLPANVVRDGEVIDAETLTEALKELFQAHKLPRRVRIGVANQRIVVRMLELPVVDSAKELEAMVRFNAQEELPMRFDEAVIDFQALGTVETPEGTRQRVLLVAARRDMIQGIYEAARAAGLRPEGIDLSAFAMVRALGDGDASPTLYLSVGGVTNLAIAEGGTVLFTRVSGSGTEGMAAMLAERAGMPIEESREVLMALDADEVAPAADAGEAERLARAVLAEGIRRIAGEARASLDFHHTSHPSGLPVGRVVVTGAAVAISRFVPAIARELGVPAFAGAVTGGEEIDGSRFAVAAGLAVEEVAA